MPATLITPQTFAAKWRKAALKESAAAKERFLDLCRLLNRPTPRGRTEETHPDQSLQRASTRLDNLHCKLDAAVCAAYGWPLELSDEEIVDRLLALNPARASAAT
jgi:hypothetical protein